MRFEWDAAKSEANLRKHHVSFESARAVFDDPFHLSVLGRVVDSEERWLTMGLAEGLVLLVVAHTYRDDGDEEVVRIISARKATRKERREYENG